MPPVVVTAVSCDEYFRRLSVSSRPKKAASSIRRGSRSTKHLELIGKVWVLRREEKQTHNEMNYDYYKG